MRLTFIDTPESWKRMLPLTYTRPVAECRIGILKIHQKWSRMLGAPEVFYRTESYLESLFPKASEKALTIRGGLLPSPELISMMQELKENEAIVFHDKLMAGYFEATEAFEVADRKIKNIGRVEEVEHPWDIFRMNGEEIKRDYQLITFGQHSHVISDPHTKTYGQDIFLEDGATVKAATLNAEHGPIYLGKGTEVQEGALIRGPFALCEHSVINMGAKIKGDSTVGPHSKVGGEFSNSVMFGYSNKGHEGFIGNSVIGEWCNLGADTNNSNLKNNYANVKMWDFSSQRFQDTGLQFCGLIMGDHSKCGINTMFNTGTTVGVSANIFGDGFPRNIIPSFSWGGASGFSTYQCRKAFDTAQLVMKRRNKPLSEADQKMLTHVFEITSEQRVWEKK